MSSILNKRYEFVLFFEVENGNPNGDPDAGNMPRIDPETSHGIVTDVCLKRKVRNYIELAQGGKSPFDIYVREKAVLNDLHEEAYTELKIKPEPKKLPKDPEQAKQVTKYMCDRFYDIRAFGAVMAMEVNCGQVRGPVQFSFARSLDPVVPQEITITRMAVANKKDADKERTMGRKHIIPYALYRAEGYISAPLAQKTGFSEADLELFWESLMNMFEHDHSAARGKMASRKLIIFEHETPLGKAPAHKLFDLVTAKRIDDTKPPRAFDDYAINVNHAGKPGGVTIIEH
ncbi:type I-C CRISPR-associated protein Cas7/Csd2 [Pelotomaculum isophthalicicum JI]|uniref:Type I-C CRISPR-associated protein Cas7/Csd2 n=1 Tax=Pelotomaculum isophthalicicum JI TaxID=947010 RepID=A0A9X4H640_9FIRM|nr:type I-C CRISPR-associated protein Cas7/Csd2 [Pelotomaculum isophthalicicum]MDF9408144.1 type I-C CRISPR-associated protein Cas7/Csd2 [Pelotomaculum isophthalicicum JI]